MVSRYEAGLGDTPGKMVLAVGVDGSGKSAFLQGISESYDVITIEPTSTKQAKAFKAEHFGGVFDEALVDEREAIFLDINRRLSECLDEEQEAGYNVAASGNELVTKISHGLMRIILGNTGKTIDDLVDDWIASETKKPDEIVFLHAPDETIYHRIRRRQLRGDAQEVFWGFNEPDYLYRYQETLHSVIGKLAQTAMFNCILLDTAMNSKYENLNIYKDKSIIFNE